MTSRESAITILSTEPLSCDDLLAGEIFLGENPIESRFEWI
jgi:hypothetical protein